MNYCLFMTPFAANTKNASSSKEFKIPFLINRDFPFEKYSCYTEDRMFCAC